MVEVNDRRFSKEMPAYTVANARRIDTGTYALQLTPAERIEGRVNSVGKLVALRFSLAPIWSESEWLAVVITGIETNEVSILRRDMQNDFMTCWFASNPNFEEDVTITIRKVNGPLVDNDRWKLETYLEGDEIPRDPSVTLSSGVS